MMTALGVGALGAFLILLSVLLWGYAARHD